MFPFTAFVDQEDLKLGLLIAVVNPKVGGVLLTGEKGTGKTTLVRSLAEILPEIEVVKGCPFHCDPYDRSKQCPECRKKEKIEIEKIPMKIVELPIGATEDMVLGTINIEKAIKEKEISFNMGILGKANRNILYIDEVNLLPDDLVDVILDAAATGWNTVEREGISYSHPAEFILIGSMNPEEGDLRPQLLDRFGLSVEVKPLKDPNLRVEVYRRREAFDKDPEGFRKQYEEEQRKLRERVALARKILKDVTIPDEIMLRTSDLMISLGVKSNRAEITTFRAARAAAALDGRTLVEWRDIQRVIKFAIFHRISRDRMDEVKKLITENLENKVEVPENKDKKRNKKGFIDFFVQKIRGDSSEKKKLADISTQQHGKKPLISELGIKGKEIFLGKDIKREFLELNFETVNEGIKPGKGKRFLDSERGKRIGDRIFKRGDRVDLFSTLLRMLKRGEDTPSELRAARFKEPKKRLILILLDASDSMEKVIDSTREAVINILTSGYVTRDEIALIYFQGKSAKIAIKPTRNAIYADEKLKSIRVKGSTPLAEGLKKSLDFTKRIRNRYRNTVFVLISDGNPNISESGDPVGDAIKFAQKIREVAEERIFINPNPTLRDTSRRIAHALGARYVELKSEEKTGEAFKKFLE